MQRPEERDGGPPTSKDKTDELTDLFTGIIEDQQRTIWTMDMSTNGK